MAIAKRDEKKELFWQRMLGQQAGSGQSIRTWCRQQGLSEARFYWWRRKLGGREFLGDRSRRANTPDLRRKRPDTKPARLAGKSSRTEFVPVHVTRDATPNSDGRIEIVLADGRCIRVTGMVDMQMLTQVLELLECRAC